MLFAETNGKNSAHHPVRSLSNLRQRPQKFAHRSSFLVQRPPGFGDVPLDVEKREAGVADMKATRPSWFEQDGRWRGQLSPCALRGRPSAAEAAYGP